MHQQVRSATTKPGSGSPGPGAQADPGSLLDILGILDEGGFNLRTAGGSALDGGGEFVFSVHHDENGDERDEAAKDALVDAGYDARIVRGLRVCLLDDESGALRRCLEETEANDGPIAELHVGTAESDGRIPVQVVPRAALDADYGAA